MFIFPRRDNGADINALDNDGNTPLFVAIWYGGLELMKELLKHNPSVNIKCKYGQTALHCASDNGLVEIVEKLLPYSDISIKDDNGHTALDIIHIDLAFYYKPTDIYQRKYREKIIELINDYYFQIKEPNCD